MRTLLLALFALMVSGGVRGQGQQKFKIFNTTIKAKEITGGKKFNDFGTYKYTTTINSFTDDEATFLWRLGSVRENAKNFSEGMFPLFDLSRSESKKGYPILDAIDFEFYEEWGFPIMEARYPKIKNIPNYKEFKDSITDQNISIVDRRAYLHQHGGKLKDSLLASRYIKNTQKVRNKVSEKISKNFSSELQMTISNQYLKDLGVEDSEINYVNKRIQKLLSNLFLEGYFISVTLDYRYIDVINRNLLKINEEDLHKNSNAFNENLLKYLKDEKSGLNSAIFAFQFAGSKTSIDSISIQKELGLETGMNQKNLMDLSVAISNKVQKEINRSLSNQFSKLWLIGFGTDKAMHYLKLKNASRVTEKTKCNRKKKNETSHNNN